MLKYENVTLSCDRTIILENVSVDFPANAITTVIGPNGSGKTTLLQALNGSTTVNSGKIYLDDQDYLSMAPRKRAQILSFLPQVRSTLPTIPVKTLVEHGRFPHLGFSRKIGIEDRKIIENAMKLADVTEYAYQSVDTLSGGVRQRVFLAMQLAQNCDYLVADEPTTYLDLPSQKKIMSIYRELRDAGKTIILVLHDLTQALQISDNIVLVNEQKIIASGKPEALIKSGIIEEVFNLKIKQFEDEEGKYIVVKA